MTRVSLAQGNHISFWCPGCDSAHTIRHGAGGWGWNGSLDNPTFAPSVLVQGGSERMVCHSFVTDGSIQFLGDSTHTLAGQTVQLPEWADQ